MLPHPPPIFFQILTTLADAKLPWKQDRKATEGPPGGWDGSAGHMGRGMPWSSTVEIDDLIMINNDGSYGQYSQYSS